MVSPNTFWVILTIPRYERLIILPSLQASVRVRGLAELLVINNWLLILEENSEAHVIMLSGSFLSENYVKTILSPESHSW